MKTILKWIAVVSLLVGVGVGSFEVGQRHPKHPDVLQNNTLRWVKDPVSGALYYGWYEDDGSAFNYVASATRNRFGKVEESNVPAYKWVRAN